MHRRRASDGLCVRLLNAVHGTSMDLLSALGDMQQVVEEMAELDRSSKSPHITANGSLS
jgi:hypothetical protein